MDQQPRARRSPKRAHRPDVLHPEEHPPIQHVSALELEVLALTKAFEPARPQSKWPLLGLSKDRQSEQQGELEGNVLLMSRHSARILSTTASRTST
jgi:hypothetical protein